MAYCVAAGERLYLAVARPLPHLIGFKEVTMSRDNHPGSRTRDGIRTGDVRGDAGYEPVQRTPPPEPAAEMEPTRVDVERRSGTERRVVDQPVEVERREMERRAVREQEHADARERRRYAVARVTQGVDYLFILLYGLLGIRFVLALLGASAQAGFVQFVNGITNPFYAPFANIVSRPAVNGGVLDFPLLIAVLAYALLHLAVRGLLRLVAGSRTVG
jgi:YggT family protein